MGCGVRMPATTSSPCALSRNSPQKTFSPVAGSRVKPTPVAGGIAHVAEDHGLHVGGGAEVVRDLFHAAVIGGVLAPPGAEHGRDGAGELLARILRKRFSGLFLDELFVVGDDGFQVVGFEVGIELDLGFLLALVEDVVELVHVHVERDLAEHLDEAAVTVVGEARIGAFGGEALDALIVHAEIEDGVHHAGHGELRAGTDAQKQRIAGVAEFLAHLLFELGEGCGDLLLDFGGDGVFVLEINIADFGGDGEAGRHGHARAAHLGEAGAFAAEHVLHFAIAVGTTAAERVNVFFHESSYGYDVFSVTISEKSAIVENSCKRLCRSASRFRRICSDRAR